MRIGVADIGSNSVRLQIVDATPGGPPLPIYGHKWMVRLAEKADENCVIGPEATNDLLAALGGLMEMAVARRTDELLVFATDALRSAPDGTEICERVKAELGLDITVLGGEDEARFTYMAVRRWFGWKAGSLLLVDIGGGSLEVARGRDERPDVAVSLPLGAGRLSRDFLHHDPPSKSEVRELRRFARSSIRVVADRIRWEGPPGTCVATSSTFRRLARLTGAPARRKGPFLDRHLRRSDLRDVLARMAAMDAKSRRRELGVSRSKSTQILAGAIVAEAVMTALDIKVIEVSPWALREGILLQRLDGVTDDEAVHAGRLVTEAAHFLAPNGSRADRSGAASVGNGSQPGGTVSTLRS
jgi:exopolyphosphatase/guanosine-5'-triphosphate,3'-diphosphate pyrophosphatase